MQDIFDELDDDCDGKLSWEEFTQLLDDEILIKYLSALDVDVNDGVHLASA